MLMDSLEEIDENDLPKLRDLLRTNWPTEVEGYCVLDTQLSRPAFTEKYNFKFYCPRGDVCHGLVAVSDKEDNYEVFICPTDTGLNVIEEALITTNVINWNREVIVPSVNEKVMACLKSLRDKLGLKLTYENHFIKYENRICKYLRQKDTEAFGNLTLPKNTYVGPFKPEYLHLVNSNWPFFNGEYSYKNLEILMKHGLTYVLYSTIDHRPMCWVAIDSAGILTALYCVEKHRRKGYSEYITKVALNELLREGKDVLAYTLEENVKSRNLLSKLGFEFLGYVWWVFLKKDA